MSGEVLTERVFAETILANGGRLYRVGGCVRDMVMGTTPKDIDFCVVGMVKKNFRQLFPEASECGKYFPVFWLNVDGRRCEVAFARTERKAGSGYKGFKIASNPKITIEADLFRRDTTVNSIAIDCLTGEVVDPFGGVQDIKNKLLRATGPQFADDPIRALRLASQAARLDFAIDADTLTLASTAAAELSDEPAERILAEMVKVMQAAQAPARFFEVLAQSRLLDIAFTEMAQLSREEFALAMTRLDAVAKVTASPKVRFAALGLTIGTAGLACWNKRMTLPGDWLQAAAAAGKVAALLEQPDPEKIAVAIDSLRRGSLTVAEFDIVSQAAQAGIPALEPFKTALALLPGAIPAELQGRDRGEWLRRKQGTIIAEIWLDKLDKEATHLLTQRDSV
jgi:tRNA nucleotidyltransferase (CCA-adding enzyme)